MPNGHRGDIAKLVRRVNALSALLARISRTAEMKELILIFRRPGWTTPAEFRFAQGAVESLTAQANALGQLKTSLLRASRAVSTKG